MSNIDYAAEVGRLRRVMAAALERVQVGDCMEAELILGNEVNLNGSPVLRTQSGRAFRDADFEALADDEAKRHAADVAAHEDEQETP